MLKDIFKKCTQKLILRVFASIRTDSPHLMAIYLTNIQSYNGAGKKRLTISPRTYNYCNVPEVLQSEFHHLATGRHL